MIEIKSSKVLNHLAPEQERISLIRVVSESTVRLVKFSPYRACCSRSASTSCDLGLWYHRTDQIEIDRRGKGSRE